jgi:hypothetical protein
MDHGINDNMKRPILSAPEFLLDCDYDVGDRENGLVVKWLFNNQLVYQWIPPRLPTSLSIFKNKTKSNFTISEDPLKKYRAVAVMKPTLNFSGEYSCSVQTFQSSDKKSATLQIIGTCSTFEHTRVIIIKQFLCFIAVPESNLKLNYRTDYDGYVHIKCSAFNVYPEPKLSLK